MDFHGFNWWIEAILIVVAVAVTWGVASQGGGDFAFIIFLVLVFGFPGFKVLQNIGREDNIQARADLARQGIKRVASVDAAANTAKVNAGDCTLMLILDKDSAGTWHAYVSTKNGSRQLMTPAEINRIAKACTVSA